MANELVLLVDDEPSVIQLARPYLESEGFRVQAAADGEQALEAVKQHLPAMVVLDGMLPKLDGFEVCRRLRAEGRPISILMLTARDAEIDRVLGLELGADDTLSKPFNPRELVARIKAILRRSERAGSPGSRSIHLGDLVIDAASREARLDEQPLELRTREFDLLLALAEHRGLVLSREQLLKLAWGFDFNGQTRTVDVHVAYLRKKLKGSRVRIETIPGVGYKLVPRPEP